MPEVKRIFEKDGLIHEINHLKKTLYMKFRNNSHIISSLNLKSFNDFGKLQPCLFTWFLKTNFGSKNMFVRFFKL